MRSIQRRLTLSLVAGALILLVVAAISIDRLLVNQLNRDFDENLVSKARVIAGLVERDGKVIEFDRIASFMPEFESREPLEYFELRLQDGRLFHSSPSLEGVRLTEASEPSASPRISTTSLPDGDSGRMVVFSFVPRSEGEADVSEGNSQGETDEEESEDLDEEDEAADKDEVIYRLSDDEVDSGFRLSIALARGTRGLEGLVATSRSILGGGFALLVAGLAALTWITVRSKFAPLRRLTMEVETLDENKLHMRVEPARNAAELEPITTQLNRLLERLEKAFEREKRFTGDVAHELKTPISELRTMAEVGREWAGEREMVEGFFADMVNLANDMDRTVSNLLTLARLEAGNNQVESETVQLDQLLEDIWKRFSKTAESRELRFENRVPAGTEVVTDSEKLTIMLVNIIANAVAYSAEGSTVVVDAGSVGFDNTLALEVSNIAPDLNDDDLRFMQDRFWRKDLSRTETGHAGLGLSLVSELAQLLGVRIEFRLEEHSRFIVSVSGLPGKIGNTPI